MKFHPRTHRLYFAALSAFTLTGVFTGLATAQTVLLTDNFNTETSFTASPNADQSGVLAPATYTVGSPFYPGNQRRGTGVLELGYDGVTANNASRVFVNADYATAANALNSPIRITCDFNTASSDWLGFVVGTSSAWLDSAGTLTEFSALLRNDGTGNKWLNGANLGALATDTATSLTIELRNTAGTGSAFNGTGSVLQMWRGTTDLGTYTLEQLSATNGKFAFCTWNGDLGGGATVDNLNITATAPAAPNRWSGSVNGDWDEVTANFTGGSFATIKTNGATSALFGDVDGALSPVTNSNLTITAAGVEIANVVFDNGSVNYSLASSASIGITGGSNLTKSGIGTLTISNANTYTGSTSITAGELILSGGNDRLPVTTALTLSSPAVLRLNGNNQEVASITSNGRVVNGSATQATITINQNSNSTFGGQFGGAGTDENTLALVKSGSGTLTLTAASSYTGGTVIDSGTVVCAHEPFGFANTALGPVIASNQVTINNGAILTGTANNWLSNTALAAGAANAITVIVNPGGKLQGGNNRVTGLGNVTLNGGTIEVTNGLGAFGWNASFTLGGDITVSGSTASAITTAAGAGATATIYLANGSNSVGGTRTLVVNDVTGSAATDLSLSARIADGTVIKEGDGTVEVVAGETGTGNPATWEIKAGQFVVANGASFEFRVTDSAANRVIEAAGGAGSATFHGSLAINTGAVTVSAGTWNLIDVANLGATFSGTFSVTGFSPKPDGIQWTKPATPGNEYRFNESTGVLTLGPIPASDYDTWGAPYGLATGSENGDLDGDGLTNFEEYAFGLVPNDVASCNPIDSPLDKATGNFSYKRRATPTTTGLDYTVWYSTDLGFWTVDAGAVIGTPVVTGEVESVPVTLSSGLLTNPNLFVRVRAE